MNRSFSNPLIACLSALLVCLIWGSDFSVIRIGYGLFGIGSDSLPSILLFSGLRFLVGGLLLFIAGSAVRRRPMLPAPAGWKPVLIIGSVQTVLQNVLLYIGIIYTTSARSSIVDSTIAFFSILFSCLLFHQEQLTARKLFGCAAGFLGVVVMNLGASPAGGGPALFGDLLVLLASMAAAMSYPLTKRFAWDISPAVLTAWQSLLGGSVMMLIGLCAGGTLRFTGGPHFAMMLWLGSASAICAGLWTLLLKYNPVSRITIFMFSIPIFGVLLAAILVRETDALQTRSLIALGLVCFGILLINTRQTPTAAGRQGRSR